MKKIRFKGNEYPIFPFSALRVLFDKEKTKYESSNIQDALVETDTRLTSVEDSTSSLKNDLSSHTHDDRYYTETEINTKLNNKLDKSLKGSKNGVAELDSNGMIPSSQLPSFVDDVLEGTAVNTSIDSHTNAVSATGFKLTGDTKECTPESGKIYLDTSSGIQYRWSGTVYISTGSFLALGETSATAYRGDRGKTAYEHSQSTHARTDATKTAKSSTNGNVLINGTETVVYTHPSGTNPHGTTKSDVGLGNVGNFKAVSTVASQGLSTTEKTNARNNIGAGTSSFSGSYNDLSNKPSIPNVVNDLTSTSTTDALSAYQGKVLNDSKVDKKDGYTTNCKVNFTSGDIADSNVTTNTKWTTVSPLTGDMIHYDLFNKISTMFKNVRYLYKMLGTTDISAIGDGTVTGGLSTLNSNLKEINDSEINVTCGWDIVKKDIHKNGQIVTVDMGVNPTDINIAQWEIFTIGTVPEGYIPISEVRWNTLFNNWYCIFRIQSDSKITIQPIGCVYGDIHSGYVVSTEYFNIHQSYITSI